MRRIDSIARAGRRWLAAALALAVAACGEPGSAPVRTAEPALWAVRDADTTIYLFGTVHALKPGISWMDEELRSAFEASEQLVLELVQPHPDDMAELSRALGETPGAPPLSKQVPPATAKRIRDALTALNQPAELVERQEPWMAALTLSVLPVRALGYDPEEGVEAVLNREATIAGKAVMGLESAAEQLGYFDTLSPAAQQALLQATLDGIPKLDKTMEAIVDAWSRGDADALGTLVNADLAKMPELADTLVAQRNRRWSEWIATRMERPGTVFVAVGAGHLAGPGGIQALLEKRGLRAERVVE